MADLAAGDLTYTQIGTTKLDNKGNKVSVFCYHDCCRRISYGRVTTN